MSELQTPAVTIVSFGPGIALDGRSVVELTLAHTLRDFYQDVHGKAPAHG